MICKGICAITENSNSQFVVTLTKDIRYALTKIFPFTEAIRLLGNKSDLKGNLQEKLGVCAVENRDDKLGGWVFFPEKQAIYEAKKDENTDNKELEEELNTLISIIRKYGEKPHLDNKSEKKKDGKNNHGIKLEESTGWMNAEEYDGDITTWKNCIYTLASKPDKNGRCKVYIGEAKNPEGTGKTRISTYKIGKDFYIDHTREEAKERLFNRFRIDKLPDGSTEYLHFMQDLAIGIAYMLQRECPEGFTMMNDKLGGSYNNAETDDKNRNNR